MCIIALTYELDEHVSCAWGNMLIYESINIWKIQLVCITEGLWTCDREQIYKYENRLSLPTFTMLIKQQQGKVF